MTSSKLSISAMVNLGSPLAFCYDERECGGVKIGGTVGLMEEGREMEVNTNKCQVDTNK